MLKKIPFFEKLCLEVFKGEWYGFKGQFKVEGMLDVKLAKAGIEWFIQIHEPFERICVNEDLGRSKDYCCMCNGEHWGRAYVKVRLSLLFAAADALGGSGGDASCAWFGASK